MTTHSNNIRKVKCLRCAKGILPETNVRQCCKINFILEEEKALLNFENKMDQKLKKSKIIQEIHWNIRFWVILQRISVKRNKENKLYSNIVAVSEQRFEVYDNSKIRPLKIICQTTAHAISIAKNFFDNTDVIENMDQLTMNDRTPKITRNRTKKEQADKKLLLETYENM